MTELVTEVFSWFILILGFSYLIQAARWETLVLEAVKRPNEYFYIVIVFLLMGLVVVSTHNIWEWSPRVAITLVGWSLVLKSTLYLVSTPVISMVTKWYGQSITIWVRIMGVILAVVGGVLVYQNLME